jgi:hypothetical protein
MAKKKTGYANEPHVPKNKIADSPLIQNASLGNQSEAPSVPFVPTPAVVGKPPIGGAASKAHLPHKPVSKLRLSGHSGAHQLGVKK